MRGRVTGSVVTLLLAFVTSFLCGCRTEIVCETPVIATESSHAEIPTTATLASTPQPATATLTPHPQTPLLSAPTGNQQEPHAASETSGGFPFSWVDYLRILGLLLGIIAIRAAIGKLFGLMVKLVYLEDHTREGQTHGIPLWRRAIRWLYDRTVGKLLGGLAHFVYSWGIGKVYLVLLLTAFLGSLAFIKRFVGTEAVPAAAAAVLVVLVYGAFQATAWLKPDFYLYFKVSPDGSTFPPRGTDRLRLPLGERSLVAFCLVNMGASAYRNSRCSIQLHRAVQIVADGEGYDLVDYHLPFELHRSSNRAYFKDLLILPGYVTVVPLLIAAQQQPGPLEGNQVELVTESRWDSQVQAFTVYVS